MTFSDLFWVFFIFAAIEPMLRQRMLDGARRRLIAKIEARRKSRVILLVHRQESMNLLGFPVLRFIDINDSEEVIRAIHLTDSSVPLDIVLHTPGGLVLASLQIARALKQHLGKVTVFIPHYAMSGGTLIALAADEIVMCDEAVLGPVDPQIGQFPAASILKAVERKPVQDLDDETLILADVGAKAIAQVRESLEELLDGRYEKDKIEELADLLSKGKWTHDYPITVKEAKSLGLHVSTDMPVEIYRLMSLFPQPVRRYPSVEYLPTPRRAFKEQGSKR
jgi:ClpP class serine protease